MTEDAAAFFAAALVAGVMAWLALRDWSTPHRSRHGRGAFRREFVPMAAADRRSAKKANIWTGRVNGGLTVQEWHDGRQFPTQRGEMVRSPQEARVADHLFARGLRYEYEPQICGFRPDFFLPDHGIVIEYWGLDNATYVSKRRAKTAAYLQAGYGLVSLGPGKGITVERDLDRQLFYKLQQS